MYNLLLLSLSLLSATRPCNSAPADLPIAPGPINGPANVPLPTANVPLPMVNVPLPMANVPLPGPRPVNDLYLTTMKKGVKFGDQEPSKVLETIKDHCTGTTCDDSSWTINTRYSDHGNGLTDGTITVHVVDASFRNDTIGDLVEVLKVFANQASESNEEKYIIGDSCTYAKFDRPCSIGEERTITTWSSSGLFDLRIEDGDQATKDHLRISIEFQSGADAFMEAFCGAATSAGSTYFNAIKNPVGEIGDKLMNLASIACE